MSGQVRLVRCADPRGALRLIERWSKEIGKLLAFFVSGLTQITSLTESLCRREKLVEMRSIWLFMTA